MRVIAIANGAFRDGLMRAQVSQPRSCQWSHSTHIRHLLSDVSDSVQSTKTVQRVHKARDEANTLVLPARVVDPGGEDEIGVAVGRRACNNGDENDQPADLEVEQREPVERWNDSVSEHDDGGCEQVQALIDNKSLPCLNL